MRRIALGWPHGVVQAVPRARLEATVMCGLIVKCAVLVVLIHIFRALGRLAGPRFSGLALGLPSTTAVVLIFCGCEQGSLAATQMAESGLLGLVAAVSLPLAFIGSVRLGWPLWGAIAASVGGYRGCGDRPGLPAGDRRAAEGQSRGGGACSAQPCGYGAGSASADGDDRPKVPLSRLRTMFLRTATPVLYLIVLGIAQQLAGPSWAGLVSTFPSLSLVVLIVTYLESGPAEASRIAQVLPSGNTSTLAFLAVFRLVCCRSGGRLGDVRGLWRGPGRSDCHPVGFERTEARSFARRDRATHQTARPHRLEECSRVASLAARDALAPARSSRSRRRSRPQPAAACASMRFCAAGRDLAW